MSAQSFKTQSLKTQSLKTQSLKTQSLKTQSFKKLKRAARRGELSSLAASICALGCALSGALSCGLIGIGELRAQSVAEALVPGSCTTRHVRGLARQLVDTQLCLLPEQFVSFRDLAGVSLETERVHPLLQRSARDALAEAAARAPIRVISAFRPVVEQYHLLYGRGCGDAASVGRSNHQSGRALDVTNWRETQRALRDVGCSWYCGTNAAGCADPAHFDCPGEDLRSDSVLAFQHLWNLNHPRELLVEDGFYGPETADALERSPAGGFPLGGCAGELVAGAERCNDLDDDLDGEIDEGVSCVGRCDSGPLPEAEGELFQDLPADQIGHREAALLFRAGITTGCSPAPLLFCPRCEATRAQLVTFVVRALEVDLAPFAERRSFDDVNPASVYHPYIEAAAELGITQGCRAGSFCPDNPATRGESASFIFRALRWDERPRSGVFEDVPQGHTHRPAIEALQARCVTQQCGAQRFCPDSSLTRAQAAVMIARAWNLEGVNECLIEHCNQEDDDLDGLTDEGLLNACGGCAAEPPAERCDGREDEDCDGRIDEGCMSAPDLRLPPEPPERDQSPPRVLDQAPPQTDPARDATSTSPDEGQRERDRGADGFAFDEPDQSAPERPSGVRGCRSGAGSPAAALCVLIGALSLLSRRRRERARGALPAP